MSAYSAIKLIVGLGNPGVRYASTRHNVGQWFVHTVGRQQKVCFKKAGQLGGELASFTLNERSCLLFTPSSYMNESGKSLIKLLYFYSIPPNEIMVVHDDLDLPCGAIKLKWQGGSGGHKGLTSLFNHLNTQDFYRLRIGIGRPSLEEKLNISDYVLNRPPPSELNSITQAIDKGISILPYLLDGDIEKAMKSLPPSKRS